MNLIKLLMMTMLSLSGNAQLMGAQKDPSGHGCVLDGGYSWCPSLNKCVRSWIETCSDIDTPINHIMEPGPIIVEPKVDSTVNPIIPDNCATWYDGCNICQVEDGKATVCTLMYCSTKNVPKCTNFIINYNSSEIPKDCISWFDGCNTCIIHKGVNNGCTRMYCETKEEPKCLEYENKKLKIGDVCYRFCEDNSQPNIDNKNGCLGGSKCISTFNQNTLSMIAYDSCDDRAWTCVLPYH